MFRQFDAGQDHGDRIKDLSISIVAFNSLKYLRDCIDSIYRFPPDPAYDLIVVDNASTDGTSKNIADDYPSVVLVSNKENAGFAAANNQAIKTTDSKYILLINSDCEVYKDSIDRLIEYMDKNLLVAAAGPKIINSDGSIQYSCRSFPSFFSAAIHSVMVHIYPNNPVSRKYMMTGISRDKPMSVDWVSGSCMMIRRKAIEETGLLDERYFMYVEDLDICYRMWKKGWEVHYMPDSEVLHHIGGSSRRRSIPGDQGRKSKRAQIRASYRMQRSVFYFFWKNYKGSIKILLIPLLFMILGLRFLIAAIKSMVKR